MSEGHDGRHRGGGRQGATVEAGFVRPYLLTGGRTAPTGETLALDAPIVATATLEAGSTPEARKIVSICATPVPLAEVAARLRVPLGVARVLVADLAQSGVVQVHASDGADTGTDVHLLERLLDGIRAL
jgi:hypothetical protein